MTNGAAKGYAVIAAKWIGLTPQKIENLIRAMDTAMDEHTESEAEEVYRNS